MLPDAHSAPGALGPAMPDGGAAGSLATRILKLAPHLALRRRCLRAKQYLFRSGQPAHSLYLVQAGMFRTSITSVDGREKITGFRMRGDLLGTDALGLHR